MKLIKTRDFIIIACLAVVGLVLGGIFDYSISEALYADSGLKNAGIIISNYLLLPFFTLTLSLIAVGIFTSLKKPNKIRIPIIIIYSLLGLYMLYQQFDKIGDMKEVFGKTIGYVNIALTFILTIGLATLIALKVLKKYDHEKIWRLTLVTGITIAAAFVIMVGIKYLASRPRPWYVFGNVAQEVEPHYISYRDFWIFHPFEAFKGDEQREFFKSFPSNHVNTSLMVMPTLFYFTKLEPKLDNTKTRVILTYGCFGFGLLMAFTRMIAGAHFLSDVSFGLMVSFIMTYVSGQVVDLINNKKHFYQVEEQQ